MEMHVVITPLEIGRCSSNAQPRVLGMGMWTRRIYIQYIDLGPGRWKEGIGEFAGALASLRMMSVLWETLQIVDCSHTHTHIARASPMHTCLYTVLMPEFMQSD